MNIIAMIIPALVPALADGFKGLFQKIFGGTKPINVDEQVKLLDADIRKLQAIAALDQPYGEVSRWVADLRASFRYLAAGAIVIATIACIFSPGTVNDGVTEMMIQMSASVFSFMFGDRVYLGLKKKG